MKLVIESTDPVYERVLELLYLQTEPVSPQRDWIEEKRAAETPPSASVIDPEGLARMAASAAEQAATTAPAPSLGQWDSDAAGIPWDRRIHAETKAKNNDGTWRYRRGVDKALVATIEAEYKQAAAAPQPLPVPPPPPVVGVPPLPPVTFADAMSLMAKQIADKKTTPEAVNAYCKSIGVPNLIAMSARPDLVPGFNEWLGKL